MYDPKFERAVRQKMEELEFRPAESVWANIEHAIVAPRRKRRVAGYYWRFLIPGLLVAGGAAMYRYYTSAVTVPAVKPASPVTAKVVPSQPVTNTPSTNEQNMLPKDVQLVLPAGHGQRRIAADHSGVAAAGEVTGDGHVSMEAAQKTVLSSWLYTPGLADQRFSPFIRASAPNAKKGMTSLTSLAPARHPWEAGFVAGGGISRLNRLNVSHASQALSPQALSFYTISVSSAGKNYISDVRPDASFDGGIYLQKALSNRWVFNTGLNLHYYSTRISVGQQVNVYAAQSSSSYWSYPGTSTASNVPLYSAGDQHVYTNRYYFLELPAAIQWKVNQSRMLPVYLQGGVSVARLMSANALYYNAQTGIYSKDGSTVNKTQLNIGSALLVGLPFHGVRIQVGPEVQYGVTSLVDNQSLGDQHMFYTGLRIVVLPVRR